jgi:hypothetical protein
MKGIPTMKLKKCIMGKNGDRPICIGWFLCLYDVDIRKLVNTNGNTEIFFLSICCDDLYR